jgi:hypothetical protein
MLELGVWTEAGIVLCSMLFFSRALIVLCDICHSLGQSNNDDEVDCGCYAGVAQHQPGRRLLRPMLRAVSSCMSNALNVKPGCPGCEDVPDTHQPTSGNMSHVAMGCVHIVLEEMRGVGFFV